MGADIGAGCSLGAKLESGQLGGTTWGFPLEKARYTVLEKGQSLQKVQPLVYSGWERRAFGLSWDS